MNITQRLEKLESIAAKRDVEALAFEPDGQRVDERIFVLHEEYGRLGIGHVVSSLLRRRWPPGPRMRMAA